MPLSVKQYNGTFRRFCNLSKRVAAFLAILSAVLTLSCSYRSPPVTPVNISNNESSNVSPATIPLGDSSDFRYLSEFQKKRILEIALNTSEANIFIQKGLTVSSNISWVAVVWNGTQATYVYGFDYDAVANGIPANVPKAAKIYPQIELIFGNPPEQRIKTAIDQTQEKVILIDTQGLK